MECPFSDALTSILFSGLLVISFYGFRFLAFPMRRKSELNDPVVAKSGHSWVQEPFINKGHFCNMCERHLTGGWSCISCRVRVDDVACLRAASKSHPCKVNSTTTSTRRLRHHWVLGNLDPDDFCAICDEPCGEEWGLNDFWCAWCCRAVHSDCRSNLSELCDRGTHGRSIIPPNHVKLRKHGSKDQKDFVIEIMMEPTDIEGYEPLFVVVNTKSGSGAGTSVLKSFKQVLHPCQIIDCRSNDVNVVFRFLDDFPNIKAKVLICGGDGTIASVLHAIEELSNRPAIAVMPLGTGNDLSRILNWGQESDGRMCMREVLDLLLQIQAAEEQPLDRWTIKLDPSQGSHLRVPGTSKSLEKIRSMTNYFSIGVDAKVTHGMQSTRDSVPKYLASRFTNKLLFFTFGTLDLFCRSQSGLEKKIKLILDGNEIVLPEIEGLVFLNIPCWGAGVKVWKGDVDDGMVQKVDDKKFEVFAVRSSFHIAKLQVGMSEVLRIGQASSAIIETRESLHMQGDGEAWVQPASSITLNHKTQTTMLRKI